MHWYNALVIVAGLAIVALGIWGAVHRVKKTLWYSSDTSTPPDDES